MDFWINSESIRKEKGISQQDLATKSDLNFYTLRNRIQNNVPPRFDEADRIATALGVSLDRLAGRELKYENWEVKENGKNFSHRGVPFYDVEASAHIADVPADLPENPEYYVDFQPFNDCTAYLTVHGDSMFPMIRGGDIIAIKKIKNPNILLWGEAYFVVTDDTANNLRTVKLVFSHSESEKIVLRASNPNYSGDTIILKSSILGIYLVKGVITRRQF